MGITILAMKLLTSLLGLAAAQWDPNYAPGHGGMIHLFEWHWGTIAGECESFLGPRKWGGVQISPPNENRVIGDRPWWERYQPITAGEYTGIGRVTEFKYCFGVGENVHSLKHLESIGSAWGYMGPMSALVFVNNHDNQRGHGGGGHVVTFHNPWELKLATAFMMAHDYGEPRVMSSYEF